MNSFRPRVLPPRMACSMKYARALGLPVSLRPQRMSRTSDLYSLSLAAYLLRGVNSIGSTIFSEIVWWTEPAFNLTKNRWSRMYLLRSSENLLISIRSLFIGSRWFRMEIISPSAKRDLSPSITLYIWSRFKILSKLVSAPESNAPRLMV